MLVVQIAIMVTLAGIAVTDPQADLGAMIAFAVLTGFAGATQDIVMDAWRIEVAPENEQGAMAAAYQWGFRVAFFVAGAVPLLIADAVNWTASYAAMAALMVVGALATVLAPRERAHDVRPIPRLPGPPRPVAEGLEWTLRLVIFAIGALILGSGLAGKDLLLVSPLPKETADSFHAVWAARGSGAHLQLGAVIVGFLGIAGAARPWPGKPTQPGLFLSKAFGEPIADFFSRFGREAWLIVILVCFYRISDFVLIIMNPFYIDLGFSLTQIADSNLAFAWLATVGASTPALMVCLALNNIAQSFAGTCLIAYMSSLTSAGFTATQYALFSSLYALPDKLLMTQSGRIVEAAARSADGGGFFAPLKRFMATLPEASYAVGAAKTGVGATALGAGYMAFFIYSCAIGLAVIPLALVVARRQAAVTSGSPAADTP
jgi:PAT family beta-lactamase induction signal transducer AmpG